MSDTIVLNVDQSQALAESARFFVDPKQDVLVICGSAGTGKTTLLSRVIELAISHGLQPLLLAPTGERCGLRV